MAGCGPSKPAELRIDGRNFSAFSWWRSHAATEVPPQRWREFNASLDELRLRAMARGIAGPNEIGEALAQEVNGKTIDDVLRLGDSARLDRLTKRRDKLKIIVAGNALIAAVPGDTAGAEALAMKREKYEQELLTVLAELAEARRSYATHAGQPAPGASDDVEPMALPREEALQQLDAILRQRSELAAKWYGDWPARIDTDGSLVDDDQRAHFLESLEAAPKNGHTVVAVYVRAGWRVFDQPVELPDFAAPLIGNLTIEDRAGLRRKWALCEAETWARKQARADSHAVTAERMRARVKSAVGELGRAPGTGPEQVIEEPAPGK